MSAMSAWTKELPKESGYFWVKEPLRGRLVCLYYREDLSAVNTTSAAGMFTTITSADGYEFWPVRLTPPPA